MKFITQQPPTHGFFYEFNRANSQRNSDMSSEPESTVEESVGDYLRNTRKSKGFELTEISLETKISVKNLTAMEENNYGVLPAEVFSRGYYALYADVLSLDPFIIQQKYDNEKSFSKKNENSLHQSITYSRDYPNIAERPYSQPFSYVGLTILLLLAVGAFLCWYFSWNPATYLSHMIQSRQETTQQQKPLKSPEKEFFELQNMLNIPSLSNASEVTRRLSPPVVEAGNYILNAHFMETTKVTIVIDDTPVYDSVYKKGESAAWSAEERINITLPGKTATLLSLNKNPIHLPETDNATLTISIPNDLQQ